MKTEFNDIESENLQLQSLCKQKEQEVTDMLKVRALIIMKPDDKLFYLHLV